MICDYYRIIELLNLWDRNNWSNSLTVWPAGAGFEAGETGGKYSLLSGFGCKTRRKKMRSGDNNQKSILLVKTIL